MLKTLLPVAAADDEPYIIYNDAALVYAPPLHPMDAWTPHTVYNDADLIHALPLPRLLR